ncbi:conserved membrane hypothetical protein [Candidatus Sulfopaludibacter sp. SbA3]|nr:conserved membrane hypothetical protein [Candidatus Sulfopaludibacter sp. SbA3]
MSLLAFFSWCESLWIGQAIRDSRWLFPAIESLHLLALAVLGGVVLAVNLSLLGLGLGRKSAAGLFGDVRPWFLGSVGVMLGSGFLLFTSEAVKLYYHGAFWVKMSALFLSLVFTATVQRRTALADPQRVTLLQSRVVALVSLLLWFLVGSGGRWIGFS